MKNAYHYNSPVGKITICEKNGHITNLYFGIETITEEVNINETAIIKSAWKQLEEYFKGKRKVFNLPLNPFGTEYMKKVWKELQNIPYGETRCYMDIAISIGNKNASRAVGLANNKNPIPIIIPCHRVIGKNGDLIGYRLGIDVKKNLLSLEKTV